MRLGPPLVTLLLLAGALLGCAEDEQPEGPGSSTETTSETPTATPGEPDDASLVRAENNPEFFPEPAT